MAQQPETLDVDINVLVDRLAGRFAKQAASQTTALVLAEMRAEAAEAEVSRLSQQVLDLQAQLQVLEGEHP